MQGTTSIFPRPNYSIYRLELSEWIKKYDEAKKVLSRSFDFRLHIKNSGGLPAENITLCLKFPRIFQFIQCGNIHYGEIPTIPQKPEFSNHGIMPMINFEALRKNSLSNLTIPIHNIHGPWIEFNEDDNNIVLEISVKKIKHHLHESFKCTAGLLSLEQAHSFKLEYVIMADNMPQKIEGKIPVIFN